jgi:hypothetical protein
LIFLLQSLLKKKISKVEWGSGKWGVGSRRAGGEGGCKKGDKARERGGRREVKKKRERSQGFFIFHVATCHGIRKGRKERRGEEAGGRRERGGEEEGEQGGGRRETHRRWPPCCSV